MQCDFGTRNPDYAGLCGCRSFKFSASHEGNASANPLKNVFKTNVSAALSGLQFWFRKFGKSILFFAPPHLCVKESFG